MPNSMTGFGSAEGPLAGGRFQIDIRTVNHRHLNVQLKVPSVMAELEGQIRERLRVRLDRGHCVVAGRWVEQAESPARIEINLDRARELKQIFEQLKTDLDLDGRVDLSMMVRQPDVLTIAASEEIKIQWEEFSAILDAALDALTAARAREGAELAAELSRRAGSIGRGLESVKVRAPQRVVQERERLQVAVRELTNGTVELSEERLAQEIAILADRLDITEEIVRLGIHLNAVAEALTADAPVGKSVGFLSQEILREINTIGSKANDAEITQHVVAMKGELEKLKEQIENLE